MPGREFEVLKRARDHGVKIKVLAKFDPNSARLVYWSNEYLNSEFSPEPETRKRGGRIEIKQWGNGIRGGVFDREQAYIIQRTLIVPPQDLSPQFIETLAPKVVGESQITQEKQFPILVVVTKSPFIVENLDNRFKEEFEKARYMREDMALLKKPIPTKNATEKNFLTL